jgi:hypothetical protein
MKKIIRLTESDLVRIVKRVIAEGFNPNQILKFDAVTGYKSALFPELQYTDNGGNWDFEFGGSNQLANVVNMTTNSANYAGSTAGGRFQGYQNEYNPNDLHNRAAAEALIPKTTKTKQEVINIVNKSVVGSNKSVTGIKAGGTYKNKEGKTVTWGRPGFTAANEMVDAICKIMNITA